MRNIPDAGMLAEGLSGVALRQLGSLLSEAQIAYAPAALLSAPTASLSPLLMHLEKVVEDVLQAAVCGGSREISSQATKIKSLTFALASSVGHARLENQDEDVLWQLSSKLFNASLALYQSSEDEKPTADLLHSLGSDIFQVINNDNAAQHVSQYIEFLCKMGREWDRLGNHTRSSWCISHAVGYAKRLEALMCAQELPATVREQCILQLFDLYLQAARESSKSMQQSLANNMLAKALKLSKQEVVLPSTKAAMFLGLAGLQVEQARSMPKFEGNAAALVLFAAAEKHVSDALSALEECEATSNTTSDQHQHLKTKAEQMHVQVLVATAKAHLAAGDALVALRKLDGLKNSSSFSSSDIWFCTVGCLLVENYLALEDVPPAAHILCESASAALTNIPPHPHCHSEMFKTWMKSFQAMLDAIPTTFNSVSEFVVATAVADAALAAIHSAAGAKQWSHVEALLKCLLGSEGKENIGLKVLATDDVVAIILADNKLQSTCYSMLRTLASRHFVDCDFENCASLLTAALQYAPQNCKAKTADLLSATHVRLNNHQKALEYLEIAFKHEGGHFSSLGALVEMSAAFFTSNIALGQKALHHLKVSPDFHIETARAAAQVAKISSFEPGSEAQVTAMSVNLLIPQGNEPSTVAPGQECALLSSWIHALLRHVLDLKNKMKESNDKSSINENAQQPLLTEATDSLVLALKLSTKRLKAIGVENFIGGKISGASSRDEGDGGHGMTKLVNLAQQGYRACVEALELGLYDQCVTMSSSTCVLLEDLVPYKGDEIHALQSNVLLLAAQSLLSAFRGSLPTSTGVRTKDSSRLHLAIKLLKKAADKAANAGQYSHQVLHPAVFIIMLLTVAALQGNQADMVDYLQALTEVSTCTLTDLQIITVIHAVSAAPSRVKSAACTALLHTNSTAGALSTGVLGELLTLAQGSKQKLEVIQQALELDTNLHTLNGVPTGERGSATSQQQLLQQQQQRWLAAECYNTGVLYSQSNPRNAIPFFEVACDLDFRLKQVCIAALEKMRTAASKQPPSLPLLAERPKKKEKKKPASQIVSQPIARGDGLNGRACSYSPLPTVGKRGSAEKENGVEPPVGKKEAEKILKPSPPPPSLSPPGRTREDLEPELSTASLIKVPPKGPESALKGRQKHTQMAEQLVRAESTAVAPLSVPDGSAFPSLSSPLPTKSILPLHSGVIVPSKEIRVTSPLPPPLLPELKKEADSLVVPFARNNDDDDEEEQVLPKRQKREAPPAAATAVPLPVAPPPSRPLSKVIAPKQILHQRKQAPGWLSSMLSAQGKASGGASAGNGGGGGGASAKRKAGSFIPPRPTATAASPDPPFVSAPVMVRDTADALSLDSGGDLF
ncbi:hypothetical protein Ndes2437B_g06087 [Nannochloris sp. 'desiccata']